ncbi:hypothetical protein GCM10009836_23540 [Pseudonocardia ailaonensis]|uniref:Uncharacterized protein n=1 Tax=Pseudonocardia ailaonensis TaxID=367279 RepID=A0ABN2N138_9PSEU
MTRVAARTGVAGAVLLLLAGLVQITLGAVIPDWTGDKLAPVALGLLTVGLAALALLAALRLRRPDPAGVRLAWAVALLGSGLLSLSTVGVLSWVPATLLTCAAVLAVARDRREALAAVAANRLRVLISALGCCQLLMAAGAAPLPMLVGALGGAAMITGAWLRTAPPGPRIGIALLGLLPFAGAAWFAIVPLLVALVAAPLVWIVVRRDLAATPARVG